MPETKELCRKCILCGQFSSVDVTFQPYDEYGGLEAWECPMCFEVNEQEVTNFPDPDDARDRRREKEYDLWVA